MFVMSTNIYFDDVFSVEKITVVVHWEYICYLVVLVSEN